MAERVEVERLDVLIVGAGISGIDAGHHLKHMHPERRFAIVEAQDEIGGTWHTHQFPGIRSDSDLYTFGFKWKPWRGAAIATGAEIMAYLGEAVLEQKLADHIQFRTAVTSVSWSSDDKQWTVQVTQDGQSKTIVCQFLWMCAGYYRHDQGYMPDYPDRDAFEGPVVHPQNWPAELECAGKKVIVIGSGATAATLIPALSKDAAHVTMLQRSPTYFYARPASDTFTETLRSLDLPEVQFHDIMRRYYLSEGEKMRRRAREEPEAVAQELISAVRGYLGPDYDVETHFTPTYRPWEQRLAVIPDGDLFQAISDGDASVVTGHIERFTKSGLTLNDGQELEADIIVSATGLMVNLLGDIGFDIDGRSLDLHQSFTHRGVMFSDVPNLVSVFGYLRSSWTLRADLVSDYVCRLLSHMDKTGAQSVTPQMRDEDQTDAPRAFIENDNFSAGYFQRRMHVLPRQADRDPWVMTQDYYKDRETLPQADLDDGTLVFG